MLRLEEIYQRDPVYVDMATAWKKEMDLFVYALKYDPEKHSWPHLNTSADVEGKMIQEIQHPDYFKALGRFAGTHNSRRYKTSVRGRYKVTRMLVHLVDNFDCYTEMDLNGPIVRYAHARLMLSFSAFIMSAYERFPCYQTVEI